MTELIKVTKNEQHKNVVSARELHKGLEVVRKFSLWVETNFKDFEEGADFTRVRTSTLVNNGAERELVDYAITLDMAKHLAMMSKTEKGKEVRRYFIEVENKTQLQTPTSLKDALLMAYQQQVRLEEIEAQRALDAPKVMFAEAVGVSQNTITVAQLAKLIKQNGVDIGQNRLYEELRNEGYLIRRRGVDWNSPTQASMEKGLFEIKETVITRTNGTEVKPTTRVTGKGQLYFVNKYLNRGAVK